MQELRSCVKGVKRQTVVRQYDEVKQNVWSLSVHVESLETFIKAA